MVTLSNSAWQFNRGEWTEAYVFLKLLGVGRIYSMDANLKKNPNVYLDIINVLRNEPSTILKFQRTLLGDVSCEIEVSKDNIIIHSLGSDCFNEIADILYNNIKLGGDRAFKIPNVEAFLRNLGISSPKANISEEFKAKYGAKTDIVFTAGDSIDGFTSSFGYSIKSHIGSNPTLYNASQKSGFIYRLVNCNDAVMTEINSIGTYLGMISYMKEHDIILEYVDTKCTSLSENLQLIDSNMDKIIAGMLLVFVKYSEVIPRSSKLNDIVESLAIVNPLHINANRSLQFYKTKIKDLLFDVFSGMSAVVPWNGERHIAGGYIDVDKEGQILYCRAVSDDAFMSYLFNHTYLDSPSRGVNKDIAVAKARATLANKEFTDADLNAVSFSASGRKKSVKADFGYVYKDGSDYKFDINFIIRFK